VRLRLERVLPQSLGLLARALETARPVLRKRFPDGADRRRAVDAGLREGGALDPFAPDAHAKVPDWAMGTAGQPEAGMVEIVLTSPDPEDLTLRQARLLGEADVLLIDGAVPPEILARARADAARQVWDGPTQDGPAPTGEPDRPGLTMRLRYCPPT
jgi:uroporphyrin-III C-methyltransferase/precorrin-2 dehydrogenase/sirohydrochlorin ferrochelatase